MDRMLQFGLKLDSPSPFFSPYSSLLEVVPFTCNGGDPMSYGRSQL